MGNKPALNEVVVRNAAGDLEVINLDTGEVISNNHGQITPTHEYAFDYAKALLICQMVREGKTWGDIVNTPKMPPMHVISHWQRSDRMFAEELKLARRERGEHYHDKAMEIARNAADRQYAKDEVPGVALAAKLYQWGAEKANPEAYGNKVTHEGSTEKPILMRVINTGISRSKPDVVVAETKEVTHGNTDSSVYQDRDTEDEASEGADYF
jgi:hypothetical protein